MRFLFFLVGMLIAVPSYAQQFDQCGSYRDAIDKIVSGTDAEARAAVNEITDVRSTSFCFAQFVAAEGRSIDSLFVDFVKRFESSRIDKEVSAGAGATSATSVVSQGPAAKVLSAAVEYGAVTRSVVGQVITLRGNAAGLPSALVRKNVFPYCAPGTPGSEFCVGTSALSLLRRLSFSVSFDAARGNQVTGTPTGASSAAGPQPVTFVAQRNQISAASARVELWNQRDVTSKKFQEAWRSKVGPTMAAASRELRNIAGDFTDVVADSTAYSAWQTRSNVAILAARPNRAAVIASVGTALQDLLVLTRAEHPELSARAMDALGSYSRYFLAQDDLISSFSTTNVFALEYTGSTPTGQVGTSNIRLILDLPLTTRTKLVANGAATFYDALPPDMPAVSRYRDAQFGLQLDHGLGQQSIVGPAVVSLAMYYQYQHSPALLKIDPLTPIPGIAFTGLPANARTIFPQKGDLWLGQAKLSLTPPGSSIKVPLSVTYSNRTELIDKPTWRGQVGIAYDLDSLLGALN
jgi:hypothetical protein